MTPSVLNEQLIPDRNPHALNLTPNDRTVKLENTIPPAKKLFYFLSQLNPCPLTKT